MAINLRAIKTLGSNFDPRKIPGLVGWYDSADLSTVYTTDVGPVVAVNSPLDIDGCIGWYDSADLSSMKQNSDGTGDVAVGDSVAYWEDKSTTAAHITQTDANKTPVLTASAINGNAALFFDGIDDTLLVAGYNAQSNLSGLTRIAVIESKSTGVRGFSRANGGAGFFHFMNGSIRHYVDGGANHTSSTQYTGIHPPLISAAIFDGSNTSLVPYINGVLSPHTITGTIPSVTSGSTGDFSIGSNIGVNFFWHGPVAEYIIFNKTLTREELASIEAYLAAKWGISGVHALATANNDPVGYLGDKSGNNRHAIQTVSANRPTLWITSPRSGFFTIRNTQNANKSLNIDGWEYVDGSTQFVVFRADNTNNGLFDRGSLNDEPRLAIQNSAGVPSVYASQGGSASAATNSAIGYPLSEWAIGGSIFTSSTTRAYRDGVYGPLTTGGNHSFSGDQPLRLLSLANNIYGLLGGIAEVIYYDKQLTETEIEAVAQYLSKKWEINLAPKVSNVEAQDWINRVYANGGTVSATTANAVNTFCEDINAAGIRDKFYRLNLFAGDNLSAALVPLYRNRQFHTGRNILLRSEDYEDTSYFISGGLTLEKTNASSPTNAASLKLTETATTGVHLWRTNYSIPIIIGDTYTWSIYVKDITNNLVVLRDNINRIALFNTNTESVVAENNCTGSIIDAGNGWYRISITFVANYNPGEFTVSLAPDGHSTASLPSYTGDITHSLILSSPQLESGSLSDYDPTEIGSSVDTNINFISSDYVATSGLTGNGSTKYLDTGFSPEKGGYDNAGDAHLAAWVTNKGSVTNGRIISRYAYFTSDNNHQEEFYMDGDDERAGIAGDSLATTSLYTGTTNNSNFLAIVNNSYGTMYSNGILRNTDPSVMSVGLRHSVEYYIFARSLTTDNPTSNNGTPSIHSDATLGAYSVGLSLDNEQSIAYDNAMTKFQTSARSLLFLDLYPGASVAYSLSNLRYDYTEPVVRVRRSNDSTEKDFYATEISDGSLASWVGEGNDGFVTIWYDQSGNGEDAYQTIEANQPKIVISGNVVLTAEGKPAIKTTNGGLATSAEVYNSDYSFFGVTEVDITNVNGGELWSGMAGTGNSAYMKFDRTNRRILWFVGPASVFTGSILQANSLQPTALYSTTANITSGECTLYKDSFPVASNTIADWSDRTGDLSLFSYSAGTANSVDGKVSELIFYPFVQTSRSSIEPKILQYYGIMPTVSNIKVQDYINRIYAAGSSIDTTAANAINDFVTGCQNDGIWDSIKACCILCGANSLAGALVPLVGAAPTNNNFVSSDYDRLTGLKGNGNTKSLDSNRANNADPQNDNHNALYITVANTNDPAVYMGSDTSGTNGYNQMTISSGAGAGAWITSARNAAAAFDVFAGGGDKTGFHGISRSSSSEYVARVLEANATYSRNSVTPTSSDIHVFARGPTPAVYTDARVAFYSIGEALDLALLDNRVSALITAIQNSV